MARLTGNTSDLTNAAKAALITFSSNVKATGSAIILADPVACSSGANGHFISPDLLPGNYKMFIQWDLSPTNQYARNATFYLEINEGDTGDIDVISLLTDGPVQAASGTSYSRTQVDSLLAALVAGGSGAPSGVPTGTRFYWDRTNLVLYVADSGSWTQLLAL